MKKIKIFIAIIVLSQVTFGQKHYPKFSWDKVSVAYHFGKKGNLLTTNEAKFIASKTNFVVLEKAHELEMVGNLKKTNKSMLFLC